MVACCTPMLHSCSNVGCCSLQLEEVWLVWMSRQWRSRKWVLCSEQCWGCNATFKPTNHHLLKKLHLPWPNSAALCTAQATWLAASVCFVLRTWCRSIVRSTAHSCAAVATTAAVVGVMILNERGKFNGLVGVLNECGKLPASICHLKPDW